MNSVLNGLCCNRREAKECARSVTPDERRVTSEWMGLLILGSDERRVTRDGGADTGSHYFFGSRLR